MAEFETDEQQLENLRKWWQENGRAVIVGVVLGLGAVGGWRGWIYYSQNHAAQASALYHTMMTNLENERHDDVPTLAERIIADYARTPYAELAALADARAAVAQQDFARARARLVWASEHADQPAVRDIARLRLARVLRELGELDAALAALEAAFPAVFEAAVEELRGDLHVARDEPDKARAAYQKALGAEFASANRSVLEMKFNDLRLADDASS